MKTDESKENLNRLGLFPKKEKRAIASVSIEACLNDNASPLQIQIAEVERPMVKMSDYAFKEVKEYFNNCLMVTNNKMSDDELKKFARGIRSAKMVKVIWLAWKELLNDSEYSELEIVNKLLKEKELELNAGNNTLCINEVFDAMYNGYIVPTENLHNYKLGEFE